jgi:hypothetical protein
VYASGAKKSSSDVFYISRESGSVKSHFQPGINLVSLSLVINASQFWTFLRGGAKQYLMVDFGPGKRHS